MTAKKPKPESATVRSCRVQLRRRLKAVAIERDKLRELASEYESLADTCDEATDALHAAIEALSKYA